MKVETLARALSAVREKIAVADRKASDWLIERDRRRRQEAAFLRGIVRIEGSQKKAALVTGLSQPTISRTLNPEGHLKHRNDQAERYSRNQNLELPVDNVVPIRRRRPDWQRREPQRREVRKWFQQYLGWTKTAQATARMMVFNASAGDLPDDAYYSSEAGAADANGDGSMGQKEGSARRGTS